MPGWILAKHELGGSNRPNLHRSGGRHWPEYFELSGAGTAQPGVAFARFRLSRQGGLNFDGDGGVGEVEDHVARIERRTTRCNLSCTGTDFWLTFPGKSSPDPANAVKPSLYVVGNPGTLVDVEITGLRFAKSVSIPAAMCVAIDLPKDADLGDASDAVVKKGIHITATRPSYSRAEQSAVFKRWVSGAAHGGSRH